MSDPKPKKKSEKEIDPATLLAIAIALLFIPLLIAGFLP